MPEDTPDPVTVVQGIYEAFGRGDVPAILAFCAPDTAWEVVGRAGGYPLWDTFKGAEGVVKFFTTVAAEETFSDFTIHEVHGAGEVVTALGHAAYTLNKTGKTVDSDFIHLFRVQDGKVVSFREFSDTAQIAAGYAA